MRTHQRGVLVVVAVAAGVVFAAGVASPAARLVGVNAVGGTGGPRTLVEVPRRILAFAQDTDRLAWIAATQTQCDPDYTGAAVYTRAADGGPTSVLPDLVECSLPNRELALAGRNALWTEWSYGNSVYSQVILSGIGKRSVALETGSGSGLVFDAIGDGDYLSVLAGGGNLLVYATIHVSYMDGCTPELGQDCDREATGKLWRVEAGRKRRVPGVGGAVALAVAAPNVAIVPVAASTYSDPRDSTRGIAAPTATTVRVVDARSGRLLLSFDPTGTPREVALTRSRVAVLVDGGGIRRVEIRDLASGALLRNVPVPRKARELSASEAAIVYSIGREIYALDPRSFKTRRLVRAVSPPVGLSIVDRRIAWGENLNARRARIRAIGLGTG